MASTDSRTGRWWMHRWTAASPRMRSTQSSSTVVVQLAQGGVGVPLLPQVPLLLHLQPAGAQVARHRFAGAVELAADGRQEDAEALLHGDGGP